MGKRVRYHHQLQDYLAQLEATFLDDDQSDPSWVMANLRGEKQAANVVETQMYEHHVNPFSRDSLHLHFETQLEKSEACESLSYPIQEGEYHRKEPKNAWQ